MAETVRAPHPAPLRRDAVLEAVAYAAERLLISTDWRDVTPEVLARLGAALEVSRLSITENRDDGSGRLLAKTAAQWCASGVSPSSDYLRPDARPWDDPYERWIEPMQRGEAVVGAVSTFPPEEEADLRSQDVVSVAYIPIHVEGDWWGCIGSDACDEEREWSFSDVDGLRTAAALLGAAIGRQRQEQRLREAETRYRSVVEGIPAITYVDVVEETAVRIGFISPQIERLLGYPYETFLRDTDFWFDLVHPDDQERVDHAARASGYDGVPFDEEYRMRRADGTWVWVHDTSAPVHDHLGEVTHFQGFLIDVTEQKDAEARYRAVVETIPAVTYIDEISGDAGGAHLSYVSPQMEAVLGYPASAFVDDPGLWFSLMHPDDLARLEAANAFDAKDTAPFDHEYRMRHADGRWVWVHDSSTAVCDASGAAAYFQGFMLDVTRRKEAEQRVIEAEGRFRTIVENTPAITYQESPSQAEYDPTSAVMYVSPQTEGILGYTPEEWATPGFWADIVHPDDLAMLMKLGERTSRSGEPYRCDYRMIARDGRIVWFHDEAHMVLDEDGGPLVWQGVMVDITERMEAEERYRHAQERLQALIDHMPAVVYVESPDADPSKFYVSGQVESMFGYTADEWTSAPDFWIERVHPDDREVANEADVAADATHGSYSLEYRFRRADGTYVWIHDEAMFVPSGEGEGFWQGFMFDVTGRKEAEEQLVEAERVLRATVEHLPAVVYREPPAGRHEAAKFYVSPQTMELFGHDPATWAATKSFWRGHLHPDDAERVLAANQHANETCEPFSIDYRFRRANGTYVWVHDEATYVEETGGRDGFWQGFLIDISKRKDAEQQLREAEDKFRSIVEQNPAVIYTQEFDPDHPSLSRTTYISPRQPELFGYTVEESLADPELWSRMVHPDDRERVLAADVGSNAAPPDRFSMEYRMIAKDGRIVWVQDDAQLVRVQGRRPYWQGFLLDITERKQAEEQLARALTVEREATARLRALDEMKNTFLQAVSHDLRTPLAAILGLAITLERGDVQLSEEDARDLAGRIAGNARRLDRLVMNLLDLDRLARGIVTPKLEPTDVGTLVRRVVSESDLISATRLRLDTDRVVVPVDPAKVERIVENLLANTARHAPATSTVWVSVQADDAGALILVEDDGPGVAPELEDAIFEPFRQGPDAPAHSPGVGVGLTLVRRFAELHGGRAWVQVREGGGASFRVLLPATPAPPVQT
jgi:PAS domain S-box-containing protein